MKKLLYLSVLSLLLIIISCGKDELVEPIVENKPIVRESISGFVQKGPFAIGTSVTVSELDSLLSQTGRNFNAQITTNDGNFRVNNIVLDNSLVEIKADGFYYNEVSGEVSENRLTLYSLSDINDRNTVNVNVLSYLEKARIEYLVESGKTFPEAKKQAEKEVLKIFEIEKDDITNFDQLDILKEGDDNAILLATSVILQGGRSVAELSELLAKISLDIKTDGILDDSICGSQLINHAKVLKMNHVRSNLEYKYQLLGNTGEVPDFEKYVSDFIHTTAYSYTFKIEYPGGGKYGPNLLALEDGAMIAAPSNYSINAILPYNHTLRVRMNGSFYHPAFLDETGFEIKNISSNIYDFITKPNTGVADYQILLQNEGVGTIEIYENGSSYATKTIRCSWGSPQSTGIKTEKVGKFGPNLFRMDDYSILKTEQTYSLELTMPSNLTLDVGLWIVRTNGTGTFSFDETLVENWEANLAENKSGMNARCYTPGVHLDMPIMFHGVGECTLELRAYNSSNPVVFFKHFTWE